jgi:hypothetical protein
MSDEDARLLDVIAELNESVRDAARRASALDTRIDSLPSPEDIAAAVEAEVERSIGRARDVIDARVGSLGANLDALSRRLAEVGEALVPLEGVRTELATVADASGGLRDVRATVTAIAERLSAIADRAAAPPDAPTTDGATIGGGFDARLEEFQRTLESTVATMRTDFEVLVRAEQHESEKRTDSLGLRITNLSLGVTKTLEDLIGQSERMAERARTLEAENAAILEAVKAEIAGLSEGGAEAVRARAALIDSAVGTQTDAILQSVTERLGAISERMSGAIAELGSRVGEAPPDVTPMLLEMRAQLTALANVEPVSLPPDANAESQRELSRQVHAGLEHVLSEIRAHQAQSSEQTSVRFDGIEAGLVRAMVDLRDVIDRMAARSSSGLDEVREAITAIGEVSSGIERSRAELSQAIESLGSQLVARTAGVTTSIKDRAGLLSEQITALAGADDIAVAVREAIAQPIAETKRETDERLDGMERDLGGIAANVNEIWIRVRSIVKGLGEDRIVAREASAQTAARIEEVTRAEDRLAVRLIEAEQRLATSMRAIETERDRVFLETLRELLEKLPRRERKIFRKRVREIAVARSGDEQPVEVPPASLETEPPRPSEAPPPARAETARPKPKTKSGQKQKAAEKAKTVAKPPKSKTSPTSGPRPPKKGAERASRRDAMVQPQRAEQSNAAAPPHGGSKPNAVEHAERRGPEAPKDTRSSSETSISSDAPITPKEAPEPDQSPE